MRLMYDALARSYRGLPSFLPYGPERSGRTGGGFHTMFLIEPILLGVSLAMDALAVSMALGAAERKNFTWSKILITALSFGIFQAAMPLIGWFGGSLLGSVVQTYGRILAAFLLAMIGGKMIHEARGGGGERRGRRILLPETDRALVRNQYRCFAGRCRVCLSETDRNSAGCPADRLRDLPDCRRRVSLRPLLRTALWEKQ